MRAFAAVLVMALMAQTAPARRVQVTVINPTADERPSETITLSSAELERALGVTDVRLVHVADQAGTDLLTQAIDRDDDGTFDEVIFQTDVMPSQTKRFALTVGERRIADKEEYRAYGRFIRERRDDFAWENDLVAHRMYGAALETWAQEPLTSSGLDVWVKRTPRLIVNDWYMVDDYHRDTGEGADLYSVGRTRGCGGSGTWDGSALHSAINFRNTRSLANGPIRVMFELMYEPWDSGAGTVREIKRITLDAGHRLNRIELAFTPAPGPARRWRWGSRTTRVRSRALTPPPAFSARGSRCSRTGIWGVPSSRSPGPSSSTHAAPTATT
jgi:pectinesterase